jgi:hypothetical protein
MMGEPLASYLILGAPMLVGVVVGIWHWRTSPRWYLAYLVWTFAFVIVTNIASFFVDPSRYADGKFGGQIAGSSMFFALAVAVIGGGLWYARRRWNR